MLLIFFECRLTSIDNYRTYVDVDIDRSVTEIESRCIESRCIRYRRWVQSKPFKPEIKLAVVEHIRCFITLSRVIVFFLYYKNHFYLHILQNFTNNALKTYIKREKNFGWDLSQKLPFKHLYLLPPEPLAKI